MPLHTAWFTPTPKRVWSGRLFGFGGIPYNTAQGRRADWASAVDGGGFSGAPINTTVLMRNYYSGSSPDHDYNITQSLTTLSTREAWDPTLGLGGDNRPYYLGHQDPSDPGIPAGAISVEYEGTVATVATDQPVQVRLQPHDNRFVTHNDETPEASFTTLQVPEDWPHMAPRFGDTDLHRAELTFVTRSQLLAEPSSRRLFRGVPAPLEPITDLDLPIQPADPTDALVHFFEYPTAQESNVDPFPSSPPAWSEFFAAVWDISVVIQGPRYRYVYAPTSTPLRRRQQMSTAGLAPRRRQTASRAGSIRRGPGAAP